MAKVKDGDTATLETSAPPVKAVTEAVPEWILCKVNVPNSHVGTIECRIPGNTPEQDKRAAACKAAAATRGIPLSASGIPQFASSPEVEFLE